MRDISQQLTIANGAQVIVGSPSILALESQITQAYESPGLLALGYYLIHIQNTCFGVRDPEATLLASSFDEVGERILNRGKHFVPFARKDASAIAGAIENAIYGDPQEASYFGIPLNEFSEVIHTQQIVWAPDGDAAFDDGSRVIQLDVDEQVRVIATRRTRDPAVESVVRDIWLPAAEYYGILSDWHAAFIAEWQRLPKASGGEPYRR